MATFNSTDELAKKILRGTRKAVRKLIAETKKNNGFLVVERNDKIVRIKARDIK